MADRWECSIVEVKQRLRTAPHLAQEIARVLDHIARDEARELLDAKPAQPLPPDADWLTRHHYTEIKRVRDAQKAKEQAAAWDEHRALLGG